MPTFFSLLLSVAAIFLILLVLVQRGRGGGLAGALGGSGGSSAFGAKAGDLFSRITGITAGAWILMCVLAIKLIAPVQNDTGNLDLGPGQTAITSGASGEDAQPGDTPNSESTNDPASAPGDTDQ